MAIPRPSYKELVNKIFNRVRLETGLTANLESSVIGALVKIVAAEMDSLWSYVEQLEQQSNLTSATGSDLDNWGLLFGVPRKNGQAATTAGKTRAIRFINNGGSPVVIPAGTRVWKDSDPQIAFFTSEGANIPAGQSAEVHATARAEGEFYNVSIGQLNRHAVPNVSVSVTNILPIQNGAQLESDASYRERILQELSRRDVLNRSNVIALVRSVPGVRDAYLLDMARGAGTFDIVVVPYNQTATSTIIEEAQALLDDAVPAGVSALAKAPLYRQLDIQVNLTFQRGSGDNRDVIRQSIRDQIIAQIDNLPIEDGSGIGSFSTSRITAIATLADQSLVGASVRLGLDGSPISSSGQITLGIGERLIIRALSVE